MFISRVIRALPMAMVHSSAAINTVVRNSSLDAVAESQEVHNSPDSIDISEGANVAGSLYQPASQTLLS